ncbi:MAG: hypothetical protein LUE86_07560 [Clostridiales bacterium]|nr:hypothetical protein [Clostridiales bacterium]
MIRVKIRLYRAHDYDLLSLYMTVGSREFAHIVRDVLRCYVAGAVYDPSGIDVVDAIPTEDKTAPGPCHLTIDDRMKKETALLLSIKEYKRPAFIKTLLRAYLINILAPIYFDDGQNVKVPLRQSAVQICAAKHKKAAARQPIPKKKDLLDETAQDDKGDRFVKQVDQDPPSVPEERQTSFLEPEEDEGSTAVDEEQETKYIGQQEVQPDETGQEEPDNDDTDDDIGSLAQLFGGLKFQ